MRWYDFPSLFVAGHLPDLTPGLRALAPALYRLAMGIGGVQFPPDPIENEPDYSSALAAFEAQPPIRILFDNGSGSTTPGAPVAGFEQLFSRFPLPGTSAVSWYLGPGGTLPELRPGPVGWTRSRGPRTRAPRGTSAGTPGPAVCGHDAELPLDTESRRNGAVTLLAPLASKTAVAGAGALHAWIKPSTPDVDLKVTISEGNYSGLGREVFVPVGTLSYQAAVG